MTEASAIEQTDRVLIRAHGLGVRRGGRWLVRGIDLILRQREIVSLIGPNGSGKSTTVKTMLGILRPDEGRVERASGVCIGYVPQRLTIGNTLPMSVRRLMALTGTYSPADVEHALGEVGISHLIDAPVQTLSGGEFQRALLARAIIRKPDVLVLDEPVQGVDFAGEIAMYELIDTLRDRLGCGILLMGLYQITPKRCYHGHYEEEPIKSSQTGASVGAFCGWNDGQMCGLTCRCELQNKCLLFSQVTRDHSVST